MKSLINFIGESIFDIDDKSITDKGSNIKIDIEQGSDVSKDDVFEFIYYIIDKMNESQSLFHKFDFEVTVEQKTWECNITDPRRDGQWVMLFKYDKKNDNLSYSYANSFDKTEHAFTNDFTNAIWNVNIDHNKEQIVKKFKF